MLCCFFLAWELGKFWIRTQQDIWLNDNDKNLVVRSISLNLACDVVRICHEDICSQHGHSKGQNFSDPFIFNDSNEAGGCLF